MIKSPLCKIYLFFNKSLIRQLIAENLFHSSTRDIIYIANVTIEGNIYPLQIDTGSSDLWVDLGSNRPSNPVSRQA